MDSSNVRHGENDLVVQPATICAVFAIIHKNDKTDRQKREREGGVRRHFRSNLSIIFTKKEKKIIAFETHLIISQEKRLNSIIYFGLHAGKINLR